MRFSEKVPSTHFSLRDNLITATQLAVLIVLLTAFSARAQQQTSKVDHLTIAEDNLVHDTQELDKRIEIFVKAIERRLMVLSGVTETKTVVKESAKKKDKDKDVDKWGELPSGTRSELLIDVKSILEEAVRNIDNAAEHDDKSTMPTKALKTLADGCSRFATTLKPYYDSASSEAERAAVYDAIANCREVIEANTKHGANSIK
ncbi:MAG: hypothetical protein ABI954_15355 [Pyrinomonadaceae bacterium]